MSICEGPQNQSLVLGSVIGNMNRANVVSAIGLSAESDTFLGGG